MKSKMLLVLMMAVGMIFVLNGTVFAEGGFQDPTCETWNIPEPDENLAVAELEGKFTASNEMVGYGAAIVQAKLEESVKNGQEHLIAFPVDFIANVCDVNGADLALALKTTPCRMGIAEKFGFTNGEIAVITKVKIQEAEYCGDWEQMMSGKVELLIMPGLVTP